MALRKQSTILAPWGVLISLAATVGCMAGSSSPGQASGGGGAELPPGASTAAAEAAASALPTHTPVPTPASSEGATPLPNTGAVAPEQMPTAAGATLCDGTSGRVVRVSTGAALTAALADARPLDAITLAPGTYAGTFLANAAGEANRPIALCGDANTVLHGPSLTSGYTLHLDGAQYWQVVGLTVSGGAKGIMLDGAANNLLKNVAVTGIGSEGIHLRRHSHDNVLDGCRVWLTGTAGDPKFGEGIYIGSSMNNWCSLTAGAADRSDRNLVQNCNVAQTTAEAFDIKEGSTGGILRNNMLDGQSIDKAQATSLMNIKGNSYIVSGNIFAHAPGDAISVHVILPGWGACNQVRANSAADAITGYGVHMAAPKPWPPLDVGSDNRFPMAASGISNAPLDVSIAPLAACSPTTVSVTCAEAAP